MIKYNNKFKKAIGLINEILATNCGEITTYQSSYQVIAVPVPNPNISITRSEKTGITTVSLNIDKINTVAELEKNLLETLAYCKEYEKANEHIYASPNFDIFKQFITSMRKDDNKTVNIIKLF